MPLDSWTLVEAIQHVAGARWPRLLALDEKLAAMPPRSLRFIRSDGIAPYNDGIEYQRRKQSEIIRLRAPIEAQRDQLWNEILSDFRAEMIAGRWTSTGSRGAPSATPTPLPALGWEHFGIKDLKRSTLTEPTKERAEIFSIRVFRQDVVVDGPTGQAAQTSRSARKEKSGDDNDIIDAQSACIAFLEAEMRKSPGSKSKPRDEYRAEAQQRWSNLSKVKFEYCWRRAIENAKAQAWSTPGRLPGRKRT